MKNVNRRGFLKAAGFAAATAAAFRLPGSRALAARSLYFPPPPTGAKLVLINLEGAYDALSLLRPITGAAASTYNTLRPILAPLTGTLSIAGVPDFGLHPALGVIQNEYAAGKCAIIQKVGMPAPQHSHFNARDLMALGRATAAHPDRRGWIGRMADLNFTSNLTAIGVGVGSSLILNSNVTKPVAITSLSNFVLYSLFSTNETTHRRAVLAQMAAESSAGDHRIVAAARSTTQASEALVAQLAAATSGVTLAGNYGDATKENLAKALPDVAKLIAAPSLPCRVFYTSSGDFDTHGYQEELGIAAAKPTLTERLSAVMQALGAFIQDLKSPSINQWNQTTIVLYTEFGRRSAENQTRGTDHGHGFHMFVLGGGVVGGMKGQAVTAADLTNSTGNLPVTIDYRTVWKKLMDNWLLLNSAAVFNDYAPLPGEPSFTLF